MKLTLRAKIARLYAFLDTGESLCGRVYKILVAGAALKILFPALSVWTLAAFSPLVVALYIGVGMAWLKWGLYRENMEVGVVNMMDPIHAFLVHGVARLHEQAGIPANGYDPRVPPKGLEPFLTSAQR
jgi:hypothetical protein